MSAGLGLTGITRPCSFRPAFFSHGFLQAEQVPTPGCTSASRHTSQRTRPDKAIRPLLAREMVSEVSEIDITPAHARSRIVFLHHLLVVRPELANRDPGSAAACTQRTARPRSVPADGCLHDGLVLASSRRLWRLHAEVVADVFVDKAIVLVGVPHGSILLRDGLAGSLVRLRRSRLPSRLPAHRRATARF